MTSPVEPLLEELQRAAFGYFHPAVDPPHGLVPDTSRDGSPVSIAVVGFALASYPVGVERCWIGREEAVARILAVLRFFRDSAQGEGPDVAGYKGFYYHFLDPHTGQRVWHCELSMIDTALLVAGALTASRYFDRADPDEVELRALVDAMYHRIDWTWAQNGGLTLRQGWKPECGFLNYGWEGYSEAILLYVLALGSPSWPIHPDAYQAWTSTYQWENLYGHDVLYAGPLFVHQFSHAWLDLRGIRDAFMREKRSDYFENSRRATLIQSEYGLRNPLGFVGYGEHCWGLSAGDGPSDDLPEVANERRRLFGYAGRGVPYGPDDGTLSVWAVLASLPFAPELVLTTTRTMLSRYPEAMAGRQLVSGFNPTASWVSKGIYGLDQGILVMMIENHRSELIWRLTRDCPPLVAGLRRAGFRGGWL